VPRRVRSSKPRAFARGRIPVSARRIGRAEPERDVADTILHANPTVHANATLHVCVTCGFPDEPRPGLILHDHIAALMGENEPFALKPVTCLALCGDGCSAAATASGKWGYLLGRLSPDHAGDLIAYARLYAAAPTGTVMPSRRAPSLQNVVIGRIPGREPAA
jgi:predicted metal-binding protein